MTELIEQEHSELAHELAQHANEAAVLQQEQSTRKPNRHERRAAAAKAKQESPVPPSAPQTLDALIASYEAQAEQAQQIVQKDEYMLTKLANELEQRRAAQIANQTTLANLQAVIADLKKVQNAGNPTG